jgi:hypothetical protein
MACTTLVPAKQQQTHELDYFYLDLTKLYNAPGMDASSQIYYHYVKEHYRPKPASNTGNRITDPDPARHPSKPLHCIR